MGFCRFLRGLTYEKPVNMNSDFHVGHCLKTEFGLLMCHKKAKKKRVTDYLVLCLFLSVIPVVFHKRRPDVSRVSDSCLRSALCVCFSSCVNWLSIT